MLQECLIRFCLRKVSRENVRLESAVKVAKRNATKTPLRLHRGVSAEFWENRLRRIDQSDVALSEQEQLRMEYKYTHGIKLGNTHFFQVFFHMN